MIGKSAKGDRGGIGVAGDVHGDVNIGIDPSIALEAKDKLIANLETQLEDTKNTLQELRKADAVKHEAEINLLQLKISELQNRLANPDKTLADTKATIAKLEKALTLEGNYIGDARMAEACEALLAGDFSIADDIFAEIEDREQLAIERAASSAYARGEIAAQEIRWADAATYYSRAAALRPNVDTLSAASEFNMLNGNDEKAIALCIELLTTAKAELGETHEKYTISLNNLAMLYAATDQYDKAEPLYLQAIKIQKKTIGEAHPDYSGSINNLAALYATTDQYDKAEPLYLQAIKIQKKIIDEVRPNYATCLNNLAMLYVKTRQYGKAEPLFLKAIKIQKQTIGEAHPNYAASLDNLAVLYATTGQFNKAGPLLLKAIEIQNQTVGEAHRSGPKFAINSGGKHFKPRPLMAKPE